ncbi:MAG: ATP-binding cassette domain-containing protein [Lysobacterales bacterium]
MNTPKSEPDTFALRAENLSKIVTSPEGMLTILDQVSLQVSHGERIAIIGASGAGKSTLLGLLAGLDLPTSGKVWLADKELTVLDEDGRAAVRANEVGFVFQSFHLIPSLTALENVMLPLELANHDHPMDAAKTALQNVGLQARSGHYPRQLSGGEKQRVAIARAYVVQPTVLFADEPTGNLDQQTGETVIEILFRMNREYGTTLVLVSHDLDLAKRCDRIIQMEAGQILLPSANDAGSDH